MSNLFQRTVFVLTSFLVVFSASAQEKTNFTSLDVFQLEFAAEPQIATEGSTIVYRR